ncbi:MAG: hypothetical protein PVSMB7_11490 [Chloroflexota bacterium]
MRYRWVQIAAVWLTVAVMLPVTSAVARQEKLRGYLFTHPATVRGTTGSCQCVWQWYTVGLRPGTVHLTATLRQNGPREAPTYAVLVSLLRGGVSIRDMQVACDATQPHCGKRSSASATIKAGGVYYILVHGEGSSTIDYSLAVRGTLYPLQCRLFCR